MKKIVAGSLVFLAALIIAVLAISDSTDSVVFTSSGSSEFPESIVLGVGDFIDYASYGNPGARFGTEIAFWYLNEGLFRTEDGIETPLSKIDDVARTLSEDLSEVRLLLYDQREDTGHQHLLDCLGEIVKMGFGEIRLRSAEKFPYPRTNDWTPFDDRKLSMSEHAGPSFHVLLSREGNLFAEDTGQFEIDEVSAWYSEGRIAEDRRVVLHIMEGSSTARIIEVIDAFKSASGNRIRIELSVDDTRTFKGYSID